jgi:hypothetical protein
VKRTVLVRLGKKMQMNKKYMGKSSNVDGSRENRKEEIVSRLVSKHLQCNGKYNPKRIQKGMERRTKSEQGSSLHKLELDRPTTVTDCESNCRRRVSTQRSVMYERSGGGGDKELIGMSGRRWTRMGGWYTARRSIKRDK